jgi:hypothetical protein
MAIFEEIRSRCADVAARARYVHLRHDRLTSYAGELASLPLGEASLDPRHHYLGHGEGTLLFFLALDSINFGSGYFPHLQKLPGLSGYFTVATHLTRHCEEHGVFSPEELQTITREQCAALFHQDLADEACVELMGLFARALNDLGTLLVERFSGSAARLVEAAGGRAERLVLILAEMPFFRDMERYVELDVPFYKRAQLTAADLTLAFGGEGCGYFEDLDRLTIFADNLVPHVLRVDGALEYDRKLTERIDRGELIAAGSAEEIEIRACGLHAVELLVDLLRKRGRTVRAMDLDYLLWNRGQGRSYKAIPRHRTRTVFY